MNIISNTCIGSYIQRDCLKQKYSNPFCWNIIKAPEMIKLIKHWDSINFQNYEIVKDKNWRFSVIIDGLVKVDFVHYLFSANDDVPRKRGVEIFYNKIWEYIAEKYEERTKRMLELKEDPIFIIGTSYPYDFYSEAEIKTICKIQTRYKIIICNNHIKLDYPNVLFLDTNLYQDNEQLAKDIWSEYEKV